MVIGEQLDLDVARRHDAPLEIDGGVAERGSGFRARGPRPRSAARRARRPRACPCRRRPPPPSPSADSRRAPLRARSPRRSAPAPSGASVPGTTGTPARIATSRAPVLLPISVDRFGRRPDERQARVAARARERGVLGEEPVAGMHGVRAGRAARRRSACRCGGSSRTPGSARCGPAWSASRDVPRAAVAVRIHRHRRDAELPAGADDAHRDLATVGDKDLRRR